MAGPGVVYKITNRLTGAGYVGITRRGADTRFSMHWKASKREDSVLYRAMRKYGRDAFGIEVLASTSSDSELCVLERRFIAEHRTYVADGGYNMTRGGEGSPSICDETRANMRAAASLRMQNQIIRQKISLSLKGRPRSAVAIAASALGHSGKPLSNEHRAKLSEKAKGRVISAEQREKIAAKLRGRKATPEQIAAQRAAMIGRAVSPETRAKIALAHARPEIAARKSAASLEMWERRRAACPLSK
ncbi:MAG: GIY-YIG nuclease family protein [Hyphomicrobiales bacterium]|nr:GIY-YIG nuclease family protein [Hyphomicrobiales bacterium]